jgi:hypothetical protein
MRWSVWKYLVYPDPSADPNQQTVEENCARFAGLTFGTMEMKVFQNEDRKGYECWHIAILAQAPVQDPTYIEWMHQQWDTFFRQGFGGECIVNSSAPLVL